MDEPVTGIRMQTKVTGRGAPLVLVPGGLTGWLSWEPHAERLSATRQVIRVQLIAVQYGLEQLALPEGYSLRTESHALQAALNGLGPAEPLDLVAWSYGAAITLDFALNHPQRVRTLALIEPPAVWALGADKPQGRDYGTLWALAQTIEDDVSEEQLEQFARAVGLCPPGVSPRDPPQWQVWLHHRQSLRGGVSAPLVHRDDPARLRAFQRPVLLVKGTGSAPWLHQVLDRLAVQLPRGQVLELPSGHAPQIVSMDRFLEQLSAFQSAAR